MSGGVGVHIKYYFEYKCRGGLSKPIKKQKKKLSISVHSGSIGICIKPFLRLPLFMWDEKELKYANYMLHVLCSSHIHI